MSAPVHRHLAVLLTIAAPLALSAQIQPTLPAFTRMEPGACRSCVVRLTPVAIVGSATDKELLREGDRLLALRDGGFVAWGGDGPLLRYDAKGRYVGTLGRTGEGPGEYESVRSATLARGDSVAIFGYGRLTIISATTGRGRTTRSPGAIQAFRLRMLPSGDALIQHYAGAPGPFVVVAPDGTVRKSFGPPAGQVTLPGNRQMPDYDAQQYLIATAPSGGFWAASINYRYGLQRWSTSGAVLQTIRRVPSWWPTHDFAALRRYQTATAGNARPLPYALGLWVDRRDRLLMMTRVADANWKPDPKAPKPRESEREGPYVPWEPTGGYSRYFDTVLDIYDGTSGELLGSWRNDDFLGEPIGQDLIAVRREASDGVLSYHVWRLVVEER